MGFHFFVCHPFVTFFQRFFARIHEDVSVLFRHYPWKSCPCRFVYCFYSAYKTTKWHYSYCFLISFSGYGSSLLFILFFTFRYYRKKKQKFKAITYLYKIAIPYGCTTMFLRFISWWIPLLFRFYCRKKAIIRPICLKRYGWFFPDRIGPGFGRRAKSANQLFISG